MSVQLPGICEAGDRARFGGRWRTRCLAAARHELHSPGLSTPLLFCDFHMSQIIEAELVTHVDVSEQELVELHERYT